MNKKHKTGDVLVVWLYSNKDYTVSTSAGAFFVAVISYVKYKTISHDPLFVIRI